MTFGVGAAITKHQHVALLAVAMFASIAVSALRTWRSQRAWPLVVAVAGCLFIAVADLYEASALEWVGMVVLVVGGVLEQRAGRRIAGGVAPGPASA